MIALVTCLVIIPMTEADTGARIEVFDIELHDIEYEREELNGIYNHLVNKLKESCGFQVVPRERMIGLTEQKKITNMKCDHFECLPEDGKNILVKMKKLNISYALSTEVTKTEDKCKIISILYDINQSYDYIVIETQAFASGHCDKASLFASIDKVTDKVDVQLKNRKEIKKLINRGTELVRKKQYSKAIEAYKEALLIAPENCNATLLLGAVFAKIGEKKAAASLYRKFKETCRVRSVVPAKSPIVQ